MIARNLLLASAAALSFSPAANAALIEYNFDTGTTLDFGGGSFYNPVGSFTFDTDIMQVTSFAYEAVQTGSGPTGPFVFSSVVTDSPTSITFSDGGNFNQYLFADSLASGGTIAITGFNYAFRSADFTPRGVTGSITAVPEPAAWALMLLGFFAIGWTMRTANKEQRITVSYT